MNEDDSWKCCECDDYFDKEDMIKVSKFGYSNYHGDWCCIECATAVFMNIERQLIDRGL